MRLEDLESMPRDQWPEVLKNLQDYSIASFNGLDGDFEDDQATDLERRSVDLSAGRSGNLSFANLNTGFASEKSARMTTSPEQHLWQRSPFIVNG